MTKETVQLPAMQNRSVIRHLFNREFVLSVIIPIIILVVLSQFNMILLGTILAGIWALTASATKFVREHRVNVYAMIVAGTSALGLIGTIISRSPIFYLAAPIVTDLLLAVAFLGSLLFRRPLIQTFAEYEHTFPETLRQHPRYVSAWRMLTAGWGILSISQTLLRMVLLHSVSVALYYTVSSLVENISTPLFLVFTFWFPRWYWRGLRN